jgi:hypothetical protein
MAAELIAVEGDKTDLGGAAFKTPDNHKVKIGGKLAIRKDDAANPEVDGRTNTEADETSGTVYIGGKKVHRNNDKRKHGAKTVATNSKVFCG